MKIKLEKLPESFGIGNAIYCRGHQEMADVLPVARRRSGRYTNATVDEVDYFFARYAGIGASKTIKPSEKGAGAFAITVVKAPTVSGRNATTKDMVPRKHHLPNPCRVCGKVAYIGLVDSRGDLIAEAKVDTTFVKSALFSRRWRAVYSKSGFVTGAQGCHYAKSRNRKSNERLGRVVMDAPKGMKVVHINGDGLDCRRANLRLVQASVKCTT